MDVNRNATGNGNGNDGGACVGWARGGRDAMTILRNGCRNKNATCRRYMLFFPLTVVPLAAVAAPFAQVQTGFAPDQLIIPAALGQVFGVTGVTVGNLPQTTGPQAGEIAADVFSPGSFRAGADWTPCDQGALITINIRNRDGVNAQTFEALILGDAIY